MKIFLTGTESFVGKELIAQCHKNGVEVLGCDCLAPCDKRFQKIDIRSKDLADAIPEKVDSIVHLASLSTDKLCRNNAYECFDINVLGTLNIIDAARKRNAQNFIFASSEWIYNDFLEDEIKDENSSVNIFNHTSEYALSKLVSEVNLKQKYIHGFCSVTVLRFGIIYGSREKNWSAVGSLFHSVMTQDEVKVGSLKTGRCFIHVSDIASGILKSLGLPGFNVLNLEGNRLITLGEIIEVSRKILNKSPAVIETSPDNVSIRNISNKNAIQVLKWKPELDLESGLNQLHKYLTSKM